MIDRKRLSRKMHATNLGRGLPRQIIEEIIERFYFQAFETGELVYTPEQSPDTVYLVVTGKVALSRLGDNRRITLALLEPGDLFGDIQSANTNSTNHLPDIFADVFMTGIIGSAQKNDVYQIVEKYPQFGLRMIDQLSLRLSEAQVTIGDLGLFGVGQRVMNVLIRYCDRYGRITANECIMDKDFTHEELSSLVGSSREAVSRELSNLKRKGLVSFLENTYRIRRKKQPT